MAKINTESTSAMSLSSSSSSTSSLKNKTPSHSSIFVKKNLQSSKSLKSDKKPCAEISFQDFLNFLRTAYELSGGTEFNPLHGRDFDWKNVTENEVISNIFGLSEGEIKLNAEKICLAKAAEDAKKELAEVNLENRILSIKKAESLFQIGRQDSICDKTARKVLEGGKSVESMLKRKLNEVIQEGLLDSILPYVVPKQTPPPLLPGKKNCIEMKKTPSNDRLVQQTSRDKNNTVARRKSYSSNGEVEVEIHVCDEIKNMKRDFRCSQKLLVSKMGYFAEVTTGQKLEDMDISVHCDITIFDWLMRWVKQETLPVDSWPKLDATNVVPILVSAAFLQMDPLLQDCLVFCRENLAEIIKTSSNLACLNDSILTRLASLFTNMDLEILRDKKDKIQSRLYCKLIISLCESCLEPERGHFSTLASIYRCGKCEKLVLRQLGSRFPCKPSSMKMDRYGNVYSHHVRDPNWNINDYICSLFDELKSWRAVYWRLWGDCHFLFCTSCQNFYPVAQSQWCCHHPEEPQFFTMEHQRSTTFPIGRFPCCGARSYRFEVLKNESGCQFKEHSPMLVTENDFGIHKIFVQHQKLISVAPPQFMYPERLTKIVSGRPDGEITDVARSGIHELLWWEGLELAPPHPKHGLLSKIWENHKKKEPRIPNPATENKVAARGFRKQVSIMDHPIPNDMFAEVLTRVSTDDDDDDDDDNDDDDVEEDDNTSGSDSNNSEAASAPSGSCVHPPPKLRTHDGNHRCPPNKRIENTRHWLSKLSIRSNQDNQREHEESAMRQMVQLLTQRTSGESNIIYSTRSKPSGHSHHHSIWNNHITPVGGTYVRLEQEWKEAHSHHNCQTGPNRQKSVTSTLSGRSRIRNSSVMTTSFRPSAL